MSFAHDQHQPYHDVGYKVTGRKKLYFSKVKGLDAAGGDLNKIYFYQDNDVFDKIDWTIEPKDSMDVLCQKEARRIRNTYDHVALWYSAGFDSQTIVDAFIKAGLYIDELIVTKKTWLNYQEEYKYAMGQALQIKKNFMPKIKITYEEQTLDHVLQFYRNEKNNWLEYHGHNYFIQKLFRANTNLFPGPNKMVNDIKSILIEGRDKPRVDLRDGSWYSVLTDDIGAWSIGTNALSFFYSKHTPEIQVKQTHLMINWLETLESINHDMVHAIQSNFVSPDMYQRWNLAVGRSMLSCLSLDGTAGWLNALKGFGTKKASGKIENENLKNYLKQNHNDVYNIYQSQYDIIRNFHNGAVFKTIRGKEYYVRKQNTKKIVS